MSGAVTTTIEADIATVTLDRPDKRNALTASMATAIAPAIEHAAAHARAVILRGAGGWFCAGFDLREAHDDDSGDALRTMLTGLARAVDAMRHASIPIVAAVDGGAIAGGCALIVGADVVIATPDARFGYPVVKLGISPAVSAPTFAEVVGVGPARAHMLEPELFTADTAYKHGLVHQRSSTLHDTASDVAGNLAAKPGLGVARTKALLNELGPTHAACDAALRVSLDLVDDGTWKHRLAALWSDRS